MRDHIRILRKAYAAMVEGMKILERQGEPFPLKTIRTLNDLEGLQDRETGEPIICEAEKPAKAYDGAAIVAH